MIYTKRIFFALAFIVISLGLLRWKPKLKWQVMIVYVAAVVYLTFLMRHPYRRARFLLDPFHAWRYVRVTEKGIVLGSKSQLKVIVLNIEKILACHRDEHRIVCSLRLLSGI